MWGRNDKANSPLARLMGGHAPPRGSEQRLLRGGEVLFEAGEPAETLYFLKAGRLGVLRADNDGRARLLGVIRPNEPAGEMALIAGTRHTATVAALRDSEIVALPRGAFLKAAERDASIMVELAQLMIQRARGAPATSAGKPSSFGFVSLSPAVEARAVAEAVAAEIRACGERAAVVGEEALPHGAGWFTTVEEHHDYVLFSGEWQDQAWIDVIGRQVDHLFRLGRGSDAPPESPAPAQRTAARQGRPVDLILLQPPAAKAPSGADRWLPVSGAERVFHLREGARAEFKRLARQITGRSVGLVLSGGGARAYAHIGAIKALRDAGVPLDFIGGVSMGAIIGAGVAAGWDDEELDWRIRAAFVESSPLDDITFPMIAMTRGRKVCARLREHFGQARIEALWRPYFCVSSDLTEGRAHVHRAGDLVDALRASVSLPGVLPPVVLDGRVLVDGAVVSNFPTDLMRAQHQGPTVGVDVTVAQGLEPGDLERPALIPWLLSGGWRRGPPIVSVLMRAATVRSRAEMLSARGQTDLVIAPDAGAIEIRDWKAYEPAVDCGYRAAVEALSALDGPVTELRKAPAALVAEFSAAP